MSEEKKRSENNFIDFYYSCVLFKKYHQYDLWFGSSGEYYNIEYCRKYIQKYVYCWIHLFLLQCFNLSFVLFVYKSPCFIKFVESGVFKYLDYHFLLCFFNNRSSFDLKGKKQIRIFVKFYFQIFLKEQLEKDILSLVIKVINGAILNVLTKYLIDCLKNTQISTERVHLNNYVSFKLVDDKEIIYFIGFLFFNHLSKNSFYSFISLGYVYTSLLRFINSKNNKNLKYNKKLFKVSKLIMEKTFIEATQSSLYESNKDIQFLVEYFKDSESSTIQQENVGLYKNVSVSPKECLTKKYLLLSSPIKNRKFIKKKINFFFNNYKLSKYKDL